MAQRISFVEESLVLPARNAGLFATVFALTFGHTFVFLSVAVLHIHPLAAAVLLRLDARKRSTNPLGYAADDEILERGKKLALLYLAYLASKLATQVATVLAASATRSGELTKYRTRRGPFFVVTVVFVAALELASTALLALASWSWWRRAGHSDGSGASSSLSLGCLLLALLLHLCLLAVLPVSIAASSAVSAAEEGCAAPACALRQVWLLLAARRKEAAVLALAASLLPGVVVYPVYALAVEFARSNAAIAPAYGFDLELAWSDTVWMLAVMYVYLLPAVGAQLYSTVAATVFYRRCVQHHYEPTIPLAMKQ